VEWDEGDLMILRLEALQVQMYEFLKGANPTTRFSISSGDGRKATNGETARVVSGRGGRIRKRLLPQLDVGFLGVEFDASEEVFSRPMNPRFGDDTTHFERRRFVAQMVGDEIEDFRREGG
jgi:hypothetical protein